MYRYKEAVTFDMYICTLWQTNKAIENGPFIVDLPIKVVIFHSYVSLPQGNNINIHVYIGNPSLSTSGPTVFRRSWSSWCKVLDHWMVGSFDSWCNTQGEIMESCWTLPHITWHLLEYFGGFNAWCCGCSYISIHFFICMQHHSDAVGFYRGATGAVNDTHAPRKASGTCVWKQVMSEMTVWTVRIILNQWMKWGILFSDKFTWCNFNKTAQKKIQRFQAHGSCFQKGLFRG